MSKWNALTAALLLSATMSVANAQQGAADTASMDQDQARMGDRDDADYGWVGLLGLAGLLGMKRRDRDERDYRRDATAR